MNEPSKSYDEIVGGLVEADEIVGLVEAACGDHLDGVASQFTRRMHRRDGAPGDLETDEEYRVRVVSTLRHQFGLPPIERATVPAISIIPRVSDRELDELKSLSRRIAEATQVLARLLDQTRDAELLLKAEGGSSPEYRSSVVSLVRERRMQRREVQETVGKAPIVERTRTWTVE